MIFRELDRPFEKNHARTHKYQEPPCLYSLTCDPPEEADQALEFQENYMFAFEETEGKQRGPIQFQKQVVQRLHLHHACCSVALRLSNQGEHAPLPPRPHRTRRASPSHAFSFLLSQILQGEPGFLCDGRNAAPARPGDASVAWSSSQGSARKFVCNKRASPVTSGSSSSRTTEPYRECGTRAHESHCVVRALGHNHTHIHILHNTQHAWTHTSHTTHTTHTHMNSAHTHASPQT